MKKKFFKGNLKRYALKVGKYLRELSVVIIGVAITLLATDSVNKKQEKENVDRHLELVYSELEYNLNNVKDICKFFEDYHALKNLLASWVIEPAKVSRDSIARYSYVVNSNFTFLYKQAAYTMFVNSGTMKNMKQTNLTLGLTECYLALEVLKTECDVYNHLHDQEWTKLYSIIDKNTDSDDELFILSPSYNALFNFHRLNHAVISVANNTKETIERIMAEKKSKR